MTSATRTVYKLFQSTRPSRASTSICCCFLSTIAFQSTRPSRASTIRPVIVKLCNGISIHKALTGLDSSSRMRIRTCIYFNPQGPHGPRPSNLAFSSCKSFISIHKALTGLDHGQDYPGAVPPYFNPQGPHGPRHCQSLRIIEQSQISIHKALTGLDFVCYAESGFANISIHKALTGLDGGNGCCSLSDNRFQSTRPSRASTGIHNTKKP